MRLLLTPHLQCPAEGVSQVEVMVERTGPGFLELCYRVYGGLDHLLIPPPAARNRTDGLWEHTCFEAFMRPLDGEGYEEHNFSPSGAWAAYAFSGYREGMRMLDADPPAIDWRSGVSSELRARIAVPKHRLRLGLSAVIEEQGGRKSYWALAHPAAKPDFHHPDSFLCEL